jgi:hypothetical protein
MPALPYIAPSPQNCGVVGQLLMVAVAVIATFYTAGAAAGSFASLAGNVAAVTGGATGVGATFTAGVAALSGGLGLSTAAIGAAAIGGAAGSIASQAVGMATGHVRSFDWRGVATGALTAGVGAGVGAAAQAFGWTRTATAVASGLGSGIVGGAMSDRFSWRQIAANVIGNAAGSAVGNAVGGRLGGALGIDLKTPIGRFQQQLLSGFVGGMVSQATSSQLGTGSARVDLASAAGDALGQALVGRWSGRHARAAGAAYLQAQNARLGQPWQPASQRWGLVQPDTDMALSELPGASAPRSADGLLAMAGSAGAAATPQRETVTARAGASISRLLGTSNPRAIEAFMRLNDLSNSTIFAGREYVLPTAADIAAADGRLGQAVLNRDNARIAVSRAATVNGAAAGSEFRFYRNPGVAGQGVPLFEGRAGSTSLNWDLIEEAGSVVNQAAVITNSALLYAAKRDGQKVLGRAWALQERRMIAVALAGDMNNAIGVFKNPDGKAAVALAGSAAKYGAALKRVPGVGYAATAVEEGAYLMQVRNERPDKLAHAVGATVTNVVGEAGSIRLGAAFGVKIGVKLAPFTYGMSIPIGAAIGGVGGHFFYDEIVKLQVRHGWTGG